MSSGRPLAYALPLHPWRQLRPAVGFKANQRAAKPVASCWCQEANRCAQSVAHGKTFSSLSSATNPLYRPEGGKKTPKLSIFEELFPEEKLRLQKKKSEGRDEDGLLQADNGRASGSDTDAPEDVLRWLDKSEGGFALDGDPVSQRVDTADTADTADTSPPAVLVLSGTTASLLPSDFFRIAPRVAPDDAPNSGASSGGSVNIEGWTAAAGGLYRVIQDRDPTTLAPRGRYFLYFGSSAAALAYAQEVRDLHRLARQALQPRLRHANMARFRPGGLDASGASEAEAEALRNFTLVPPTARLDLTMQICEENGQQNYEPASGSATATTKVLLALSDAGSRGGLSGESSDEEGGVLTVVGLRGLIAADGSARNLPWAVSDGLTGVVPVKWLVLAEQQRDEKNKGKDGGKKSKKTRRMATSGVPDLGAKTEEMNDQATYAQFVVAFSDAVEARRFVRSWHRRTVTLPRKDSSQTVKRKALVDATVLW